MTAKQYLQQIKKINVVINCKQKELDSLNDLTQSITNSYKFDSVQSSGDKDKIGNAVAKMIDLQRSINEDIDRLVDLKREIMNKIETLDGTYLDLLYKRYFEFKTWETIAVEIGYTYQWVCELHGKALQKLQNNL